MVPAIVLSGQTAGLGVIRALGIQGLRPVLGYNDAGDMGRKSKFIQSAQWLPHPERQEADYVQCLLDLPVGLEGAVVFPTSDATLSVVSRNKERLGQKYRVACPDWAITEQFLDKKNTSQLAEQLGVPAPKTFLPHRVEDIEDWGPRLQFPCLAKPSQVHLYHQRFDRKMVFVKDMRELVEAFRETEGTGIELMVQEYIPGEDGLGANYNAYYWEGRPLCEFTARKIRNAPPRMGSPCVLVSEVLPDVIETGRKLLGPVGFSGYACTEFKRDPRDGVYKLMEVNVRHNLSSLLAVKCGLNFPWLHYRHLAEGQAPGPQGYETGIFWIDITRDLLYRAANLGKEPYSLSQLFTPYINKHIFAVLDGSDPYPALLRTKDVTLDAIRRIFS